MQSPHLYLGRRLCLFLTFAVLLAVLSLYGSGLSALWPSNAVDFVKSHLTKQPTVPSVTVQEVLGKLVDGRWVGRTYRPEEMKALQKFLDDAREGLDIPRSLERKDNKCGNVEVRLSHQVSDNQISWFRALCDPFGSRPCCYDNRCANRSVQECRCPHCYDMRQQIHSELATWIPWDPLYKVEYMTDPSAICELLQGRTIIFLGDSIMRQMYTSVLSFVYSGDTNKLLLDNMKPKLAGRCSDLYYVYFKDCRGRVRPKVTICNNSTQLEFVSKTRGGFEALTNPLIEQPKSLLVMSQGIHFHYNDKDFLPQLKSWLDRLPNTSLSKLLWVNYHCPGLLKTPRVPDQLAPNVLRYNNVVNAFLRPYNVTILDFFNISKEVMSYDGVHAGKGVSDLKAQIFFRYLKETKYRYVTY